MLRKRIYFPGVDFNNFSQEAKEQIESDIKFNLIEAYKGVIQLKKGARLGVYIAYIYFLKIFNKIKGVPPDLLLFKRQRINNFRKVLLLISSYFIVKFNFIIILYSS